MHSSRTRWSEDNLFYFSASPLPFFLTNAPATTRGINLSLSLSLPLLHTPYSIFTRKNGKEKFRSCPHNYLNSAKIKARNGVQLKDARISRGRERRGEEYSKIVMVDVYSKKKLIAYIYIYHILIVIKRKLSYKLQLSCKSWRKIAEIEFLSWTALPTN